MAFVATRNGSQGGSVTSVFCSQGSWPLRILLSLALALTMVVIAPDTALAFDGPKQDAYNGAAAVGTANDPYRILVTKIGDPEQTRPSAFWSGTGTNTASGGNTFVPFAVAFEQRSGNTAEGALVSSMSFDMHDGAGRHDGVASVGPVLAGGADGSGADVWSGLGASLQSNWVYAFRLAPYSAQDTSTGDLRIGFAWHGCFATYFDSWEYAFDAVGATSGLTVDKQVKAGDTITLSYYGGYDVGQTSRGTGYSVDFSNTSTVNTSGSALSVVGDPTTAVYEAVVGDDGFARFNGSSSIQFGGNYTVAIKERAPEPRADYVGDQGTSGKLTVSGFDEITTEEGTYRNFIENTVDVTQALSFNVALGGAGVNWGPTRYPGGSPEAWLGSTVYPQVSVVNSDGVVVASKEKGNLACTAFDAAKPCTNMTFSVSAGTFEAGKSYVLTFGPLLSGPNTGSTIGYPITFTFSTAGAGESVGANKTELNRVINQVKADIPTVKTSVDGTDVVNTELWVSVDNMRAIADAVDVASAVAADAAATQGQTDEATTALGVAWNTFKASKQAGTKIVVSQQWDIGKDMASDATASLYSDGTLVIAGKGNLQSFARQQDVPWNAQRPSIVAVKFEGETKPTSLDYYFAGCAALASVSGIPDGVLSAERTFSQCTSLVMAPKLPDSVQNLKYTFEHCSSLVSIESIPTGATQMAGTFSHCGALKTVPAVPDLVEDMSQTYWNAVSLESVANLPASTKSYSYTFQGCTALKAAPEIPAATTHVIGMFDGCSSLTRMPSVPEGVRMLFNAFRGCSSLASISAIPSTVTDATRAFANCTSLVEIPASFSLPAAANTTDMFKVESPYSASNLLQTYTLSSDAKLASYDWAASNRALVKSAVWEIGKDNPGDVVAGLLENGTLEVSGVGAMKDFASAAETPWASQASAIKNIQIAEGVTTIGSFAFSGLSHAELTMLKLPAGMTEVGKEAFSDCSNVLAVDLTACVGLGAGALKAIGDGALCGLADGACVYVREARVASLVKSLALDAQGRTGGNVDRVSTALAVTNGGTLPEGGTLVGRQLVAFLEKEGSFFSKWTTDLSTMHPATSWRALSSGTTYYAKFVKSSVITVEPSEYPGNQGLDQMVRLLDLSKLPGSAANQTDILSYGADADHFLNKITTSYNGSQDIVFAFSMARGGNTNGGDGAYQKSFSLPFVSILDSEGATVASYDNGAGKLKLFSTVFDGEDGKSQGNNITAFRVGVVANELPAGTYTLRFGAGFGANNGTSFLDRNVDFVFTVESPELYRLSFDTSGAEVAVTGIQISEGAQGVDVLIPDTYAGKTVSRIADDAFKGAAAVRSVEVPDSVTHVGSGAFSQMSGLQYVKMIGKETLSGAVYQVSWGAGVFTGSAASLLYGWPEALSVKAAAEAYDNVEYCPLSDGVYVGGQLLGSAPIVLTAESPSAVVSVIVGGQIVTDGYTGRISNVNAVGHPGTTRGLWQQLIAKANGAVTLKVGDRAGVVFTQGQIVVSGFSSEASMARVPLGSSQYQGDGSTVCLTGSGAMETASYDETLDAFDNYLTSPVVAEGATFTLNLGGPGSAWDGTRWDWDDWTTNHLNDYVWIEDVSGVKAATIESGLHWIKLGGNGSADNAIVLGVDPGVFEVGSTYTLVAGANMTGHNVAARLMKDVRWTFTTKAADLATTTIAAIPVQTYTGVAVEPAVEATATVLETTLWDEATETPVVTPASTRTLTRGVDYGVSYQDNNAVGTGKAELTGLGSYAGSTTSATFSIVAGRGDLTKLKAAIGEAQAAVSGVVSSKDGKDVAPGVKWATPEQIKALNDSIATAQEVAGKPETTQDAADAALAALSADKKLFDESIGTAAPVRTYLQSALADARAFEGGVRVSPDGKDVPRGTNWATTDAKEQLLKAVASAQGTFDDALATQNDIDKARESLAAAQDTFKAAVRVAQIDVAGLNSVIETAVADQKATVVSVEGGEVYTTDLWVTQDVSAALTEALTVARAAMAREDATQNDLDVARAVLEAAQRAFDAAKQAGLKVREPSAGGSSITPGALGAPGAGTPAAIAATGDPAGAIAAAVAVLAVLAGLAGAVAVRRRAER